MSDMALGVLFMVLFIVGLMGIIIYRFNLMIKLRASSFQAYANIAVSIKKRQDLIPELTILAKRTLDHESTIFTTLTNIRTAVFETRPQSLNRGILNLNATSRMMESVLPMIVEQHPEIKSMGLFETLQRAVSDCESEIAYRTTYYNDYAKLYNEMIQTFPNMVIAKIGNLTALEYLH